MYRQQF